MACDAAHRISVTTADRVLLYVGGTICILAIVFGIGALFLPDFRGSGALIVGTILGALTTMASIIVGTSAARAYNKKNGEDETAREEERV